MTGRVARRAGWAYNHAPAAKFAALDERRRVIAALAEQGIDPNAAAARVRPTRPLRADAYCDSERMPAQAWVTLIIGSLAAIGVIVTWQQKNRADRRSEWWRRTTWAFERTFSTDTTQAQLGWKMLTVLAGSKLATKDDSDFVQVIAEHEVLATTEDAARQEDNHGGSRGPGAAEAEAQS